jgi:hypothetical protein
VVRDIEVGSWSANWTSFNVRRRPVDLAIQDVASGNDIYFTDPRDERKYAAQVEALRGEIAAKKKAQPGMDQVG